MANENSLTRIALCRKLQLNNRDLKFQLEAALACGLRII
jgi:hypothetical protein